ncbi:hypothetical protein Asulf_00515 [Archaeoglobus sulfaticallidus PM70-1]|uniref:Uncharacterized protein n=1 Tax=Archaeoglobus sulfaticallidus PM70-1 TaxID=387631 RepID=N0BC33_9EURY|nr:hypothetical protein [Archaeoglobus sulfaticallidus]AGK60538.1 hypothetical protein Asulf_00515 [Archaeoglobus sulfaticallidus PM70-1]
MSLDLIKEGFSLFVKNLQINIPVYLLIFLGYLIIAYSLISVIPGDVFEEIGMKYQKGELNEKEVLQKMGDAFYADFTKNISTILLFSFLVFILHEFDIAGLTASSLKIAREGYASIRYFFESAYLNTMKVIKIDLLGILILIALSSPSFILYYLNFPILGEAYMSISMTIIFLLLTFSKFAIVDRDAGVFDAVARGSAFLLRNSFTVILAFFAWFVISFPIITLSAVFPPLFLALPLVITLFHTMMGVLYSRSEGSALPYSNE